GGSGCAQLGGGLGEDNCCQSEIEDFGELCSVTMAAPCVVDGSAPAPSPVAMPTAPVAEPTAPVREPTAPVAEPTAPVTEPTAPVTEPTAPADVCSNGIPGIQSGNACCLAECGGCGGSGCAQLGGGLGEDNCCQSEIED
ncbi:unnamed protein product, partial [Ectocarpus sp. 8 AP-2014]